MPKAGAPQNKSAATNSGVSHRRGKLIAEKIFRPNLFGRESLPNSPTEPGDLGPAEDHIGGRIHDERSTRDSAHIYDVVGRVWAAHEIGAGGPFTVGIAAARRRIMSILIALGIIIIISRVTVIIRMTPVGIADQRPKQRSSTRSDCRTAQRRTGLRINKVADDGAGCCPIDGSAAFRCIARGKCKGNCCQSGNSEGRKLESS